MKLDLSIIVQLGYMLTKIGICSVFLSDDVIEYSIYIYIIEVKKPCYDSSVVRFIGKTFLCVYMYMYIQVEKILHYVLY